MASAGVLVRIAPRKNARPAQIALAWLLTRKRPWIAPIPGTTKPNRFEENIGAIAVQLAPDDLRDMESAATEITVHGAHDRRLSGSRVEAGRIDHGGRAAKRIDLRGETPF